MVVLMIQLGDDLIKDLNVLIWKMTLKSSWVNSGYGYDELLYYYLEDEQTISQTFSLNI